MRVEPWMNTATSHCISENGPMLLSICDELVEGLTPG